MQEYKVEGHISSYLPENRNWKLIWADEFDGPELDTSKWELRTDYWGKPAEAYTDQGIAFDGNSNIELHRVERNGLYVSPQLQTGCNSFDVPLGEGKNTWKNTAWPLGDLRPAKFVHRFGYFEVRCKFPKRPHDMWSAFWLQSPSIGTSYDPAWCGVENDIMECFDSKIATTGNIFGGYGNQIRKEGRVQYPLKPTEDGYHTFALHWTPEKYVFYCDGEVVTTAEQYVSQVPQFILLSTEVMGYRLGCPLRIGEEFIPNANKKTKNDEKRVTGEGFVDDCFVVDYVRVFDEVE